MKINTLNAEFFWKLYTSSEINNLSKIEILEKTEIWQSQSHDSWVVSFKIVIRIVNIMSSQECECVEESNKPKKTEKPRQSRNPLNQFNYLKIGDKQKEILMYYRGSALKYSMAAGILLVYATDWKAVLQYFPYINGAYQDKN